jgi:hypothetical protein
MVDNNCDNCDVVMSSSLQIIKNFVKDLAFEEIKEKCKENDIIYREHGELYLLISKQMENQNNFHRAFNGVILEKGTNNIAAMCQSNFISNQTLENIDLENVTLEFCEDGTLIRLYNYNDNWFTATNKCVDAKGSYWSNPQTFDEMFWELFDQHQLEMLDKTKTYLFVLLNKDNRIVVNHTKNELVFVGLIDNFTGFELNQIELNNYYVDKFLSSETIRRSIDITNRLTEDRFSLETILSLCVGLEMQMKRGVLLKTNNMEEIYKFDFPEYTTIKMIRGNVPHIRIRYLELLNDKQALKTLEQYYSEYLMLFTMIKHSMDKLYKTVHFLYIKSHVKHELQVQETHLFFQTLRQLHGQYKKTNKPITLEDVKCKIDSLDTHVIKKFLGWV